MATMDAISMHGGEAANFLDVGGGADAEGVAEVRLTISLSHISLTLPTSENRREWFVAGMVGFEGWSSVSVKQLNRYLFRWLVCHNQGGIRPP